MSFYPMSEAMLELKSRYREHGLLLPTEGRKGLEKTWRIAGRAITAFTNWSKSGAWDFFLANGHVITQWFAVGHERVLLPEAQRVVGLYYLVIGPLVVLLEWHKTEEEEPVDG